MLVPLFLFVMECSAQSTETSGKPIAEIFTDFHYNINDTTKHTGFDLNRAHIGYEYKPGGKVSAKIMLNIGSPDDLSVGSLPLRYAYFKEASMTWANEKLSISVGITNTRLAEFQQNFWEKRYIANSLQSLNGYGFVADKGILADYKFNKILKVDVAFMNGEGYSSLQLDDNIKSSVSFTITPSEFLAFKIYGDIQRQEELWQKVCYIFAGIKNPLLTIGGELSYKTNSDLIPGHHIWGFSATGGINIMQDTQVFGRYDYTSSVIMKDDIIKWNYLKDGSFYVFGIEQNISPYIKIALDYQERHPYSSDGMVSDLLYINALFKF